ncbi:MAG TPA: hypothetical protein VIJ27_09840 [Mucilaginibacter sp.]
MKKIITLIAILFGAIYSASAQYYNNNASAPKFGVSLSSGAAVGPASGAYPDANGTGFRVELPVNHSPVSILLSAGYTFYVSQGSNASDYYSYYDYGYSNYYSSVASFIPVEAGIKVYVIHKFFIEGDAGVSFNINSIPSDYTGQATSFIYSPAAGYSFPLDYSDKSNIDLSLVYENRLEPGGGYSQVAVRAVWNFNL